MKLIKSINEINIEKYIIATYQLSSSKNLKEAAWNLAIGQSVGNPNVRNHWETDELFDNHSCFVLSENPDELNKTSGEVKIAFPVENADWKTDGISQLICHLMGGQMDIDVITACRLIDVKYPKSFTSNFLGPKYGMTGMRKFTGQYNKPLFGAIIKPKIGVTPEILLEMVKELVDGGVDFIKEDEIMSSPPVCPLEKRVPLISNYLRSQSRKLVYCYTINSDPHAIMNRAKFIADNGGNGLHINVWSGLGSYNSVRQMDLPIYIHFQKSGDKTFTDKSHRFSISWNVICDLAGIMGADTIHSGMWGGYMNESEEDLRKTLDILNSRNVVPALSCGMHAGLIDAINDRFGTEYMANVGGAIHGHPDGTIAGTKAMRQAIDKTYGDEYYQSIQKWGKKQ
jgi:ribulose-bisphosphate carboxylase large chain